MTSPSTVAAAALRPGDVLVLGDGDTAAVTRVVRKQGGVVHVWTGASSADYDERERVEVVTG